MNKRNFLLPLAASVAALLAAAPNDAKAVAGPVEIAKAATALAQADGLVLSRPAEASVILADDDSPNHSSHSSHVSHASHASHTSGS